MSGKIEKSWYDERYLVKVFAIFENPTRLVQTTIADNHPIRVSISRSAKTQNAEAEGKEGSNVMSIPRFRRTLFIGPSEQAAYAPSFNFKHAMREAVVSVVRESFGLDFGELLSTYMCRGIFTIADVINQLKDQLRALEKNDGEDKQTASKTAQATKVKNLLKECEAANAHITKNPSNWKAVTRLLGTMLVEPSIFGLPLGVPSKGKLPEFTAYATISELQSHILFASILDRARLAGVDFAPFLESKWTPLAEFDSEGNIDIGSSRGEDNEYIPQPAHLRGFQYAPPGTTWLFQIENPWDRPMNLLELELFALGWYRFSLSPVVGQHRGRIACRKFILRVIDIKAPRNKNSEVYVGQWSGYDESPLQLEKFSGELNLNLDNDHGTEHLLAHLEAAKPYVEHISGLDRLSIESLKEITVWTQRWADEVLNGGKVKQR